jgi:HDOD domain
MGWLSRLFGGQPAAGPGAGPVASTPPAANVPDPAPTAADRPPFLCWLFDVAASLPALTVAERQALEIVDRVLAQASLPAELLPRSANVVPQLIALLRQDDLPLPALVDRIGKDPVLMAEVLRQAGSARFAHMGPVQDLAQAVQRLGTEGLQMAIARVLLRPMYPSRADSLVGQVSSRLWDHADALSHHCAQAARDLGASGFDGYLVGLLHGTGWTVLLHCLQRGGVSSLGPFSLDCMPLFEARAHALFGRAAESWQITPAFTAFAVDARRVPLADSKDLLAQALKAAQGPSLDEMLSGGGQPAQPA